MCLAVPMAIEKISGVEAICSAKGVRRSVSLFMLQDRQLKIGDWVLVHVGYAIQIMTPDDARESWRLLDQALLEE